MAAAIPRFAVLGPPAKAKPFLTGGDFSCSVQGFQKGWWTNADLQASQITRDEPSEASFYPQSWGTFSFVDSSDPPRVLRRDTVELDDSVELHHAANPSLYR